MVMDALRGYLQLASGLTDVTREKARLAAKAVVAQAVHLGERPGDARSQVRTLADELATTARANRDHLVAIVRVETERAVTAIGVASTDDVAALRRRVDALERRLTDLGGLESGAAATTVTPTKKAAAPKKAAPAKAAQTAKAAPAKKSPRATKTPSGSTARTAAARTSKRAATTPDTDQ